MWTDFNVYYYSQSGDYLLTGAENGCVRIHHLYSPYSLSSLDRYWSLSMHDSQYGYITSLSLSHDNKYLITGGADGNVFVYKANLPATTKTNRSAKISKQVMVFFIFLLHIFTYCSHYRLI